jgi:hypothetical protein
MTLDSQDAPQARGAQLRPRHLVTRREFLAATAATTTLAATLGADVLLAGCDAPPAYGILLMMPIQSIQDSAGSIPLIAGKRTIIRVFPVTNAGQSDVTNISGQLNIFIGDSMSGAPAGQGVPLNGPISSRPSGQVRIDEATHSLDFEVPLNLISGHDLTIQCQLTTTGGAPFEVSATSTLRNFRTIAQPEKIHPVLWGYVLYGRAAPTMADFQVSLAGVIKRLPVPETHYIVHDPMIWSAAEDMTTGEGFYDLCTQMATRFQFDPSLWESGFPVGLIFAPATLPSVYVDGMYYNGYTGSVAAFAAGTGPDLPGTVISRVEAETTLAHEFSHNYGLGHAGACLNPANVDPTLPMSTDMTGMDVPLHTIMPKGTSELMSYCSLPRWPSSTTYNRVLARVSG